MKLTKKILAGVFILLALTIVGLNMFQDKLIFRSQKLDGNHRFEFDQPFEEHFLTMRDSITLNALFFPSSIPSKGLILYFHGNAGNLQRWGRYASHLTPHGYDVLMIDYRGYGKSGGAPSEQALYDDADEVLAWAKARYPFSKLIIYGRSLGSAVASHLAMTAKPDLLILETPFDELKGAVPPALQSLVSFIPLRSVFPNNEHLRRISCRKIIFHGTNDRVVPLVSALRLKPLLSPDDEFITIPDGTHRNLGTFDAYKEKIAEILK